jgi:hypothetical protein
MMSKIRFARAPADRKTGRPADCHSGDGDLYKLEDEKKVEYKKSYLHFILPESLLVEATSALSPEISASMTGRSGTRI